MYKRTLFILTALGLAIALAIVSGFLAIQSADRAWHTYLRDQLNGQLQLTGVMAVLIREDARLQAVRESGAPEYLAQYYGGRTGMYLTQTGKKAGVMDIEPARRRPGARFPAVIAGWVSPDIDDSLPRFESMLAGLKQTVSESGVHAMGNFGLVRDASGNLYAAAWSYWTRPEGGAPKGVVLTYTPMAEAKHQRDTVMGWTIVAFGGLSSILAALFAWQVFSVIRLEHVRRYVRRLAATDNLPAQHGRLTKGGAHGEIVGEFDRLVRRLKVQVQIIAQAPRIIRHEIASLLNRVSGAVQLFKQQHPELAEHKAIAAIPRVIEDVKQNLERYDTTEQFMATAIDFKLADATTIGEFLDAYRFNWQLGETQTELKVACDPQLLSRSLPDAWAVAKILDKFTENALKHGDSNEIVRVAVSTENGRLTFDVLNEGTLDSTFLDGTGLSEAKNFGLFIASQEADQLDARIELRQITKHLVRARLIFPPSR